MPQGRRDYSSSSSSSSSASKSATFSTNATADGGEGEGPAEANGERGAAEDTNATPEKGTEDDDENPLEGYAEDDADPGPPPPLDPSVVSEPSPKVRKVVARGRRLGGFRASAAVTAHEDNGSNFCL